MDLSLLVALATFVILALVAATAIEERRGRRACERALTRVDARLDEQARRGETAAGQTLDFQQRLLDRFVSLREGLEQRQGEAQASLLGGLAEGVDRTQRQMAERLSGQTDDLVKRMEALTRATDERLALIGGQVERRLSEGLEKTHATFADIQRRLALIDDAQQKITELSSNVVSLEQVLADRTARGAFGEVQLRGLVRNVLPESAYRWQHQLSNGCRVDCALLLPEPTGLVPVDSKFPLENYRRKADPAAPEEVRRAAERDFRRDVQVHIDAVAAKYVLPGETSDGAVLFLPAEAVFAEIHGAHPDLVERAQRLKVWLTSPTTLMAILTTAAAVLRDCETRRQVHVLQDHLRLLGRDFDRFRERMESLARHIEKAHEDVGQAHISARKLSSRFEKIERLDLERTELPAAGR